jgi:hypothetical protein
MFPYCPLCERKHRPPIKGSELQQHRINLVSKSLELVLQWKKNKEGK